MKNIVRNLFISLLIVVANDMIAIQSLLQLKRTYSWMGEDLINLSNYFIKETIIESLPAIVGWFIIIELACFAYGYVKEHYTEWVSELKEDEA